MLLGVLGLFAIATMVFSGTKMHDIDGIHSVLLTKDVRGAATLIHLNARLLDTSRLSHGIIVEDDPTRIETASEFSVFQCRDGNGQMRTDPACD